MVVGGGGGGALPRDPSSCKRRARSVSCLNTAVCINIEHANQSRKLLSRITFPSMLIHTTSSIAFWNRVKTSDVVELSILYTGRRGS